MSAAKLTLRLDESIIRKGKEYAKRKNTSLSKLFENYIRQEVAEETYEPIRRFKVSDEVKRIGYPAPMFDGLTDKELREWYIEQVDA